MNEVVKREENTSIDLRKKQKRELKKTVGHMAVVAFSMLEKLG